ncbi:putative transcription factor GeBP family [Helianthus annuus]|nr:putative transcription factor GeBP family [Helianthus annuus]
MSRSIKPNPPPPPPPLTHLVSFGHFKASHLDDATLFYLIYCRSCYPFWIIFDPSSESPTNFSTTQTLNSPQTTSITPLSLSPTMAGSENEPTNSSSGEEEEEVSSQGSESESETQHTLEKNPQLPDPNINNPRSKNPISPLTHPTGKRPVPEAETETESSDLKRVKTMTSPDANNGGEKKQLFQRLWSEDNEIELIQGMISYVDEKGKDPVADVNDFHEFVKKSLHVDVNDRQMLAKARRLKKKFENNVARVVKNGKVRSFSNPHEKRMYELSKNLWGDESNKKAVMSSCSKKVKVKVNAMPKTTNKSCKPLGSGSGSGSGNGDVGIEVGPNEVEVKVVQPLRSVGGFEPLDDIPITDEAIMNKGLELVAGPKKAEMEEKWKSLKVLELEHFMKKMDVLKEQAAVVLNAIANSVAK